MKSTNHVTHCFERALRKTVFKQVYTTLIRKYSKYYPHRLIQYILPSYVNTVNTLVNTVYEYTPSYVNTVNTVVNTRTVYTTLIMAPFIKAFCTLFCHTIKWAAILLLRFFCCDYLSGYRLISTESFCGLAKNRCCKCRRSWVWILPVKNMFFSCYYLELYLRGCFHSSPAFL